MKGGKNPVIGKKGMKTQSEVQAKRRKLGNGKKKLKNVLRNNTVAVGGISPDLGRPGQLRKEGKGEPLSVLWGKAWARKVNLGDRPLPRKDNTGIKATEKKENKKGLDLEGGDKRRKKGSIGQTAYSFLSIKTEKKNGFLGDVA